MRYHGPLYRALNPLYALEPLSGRGAELYGGRFNLRGTPALYASLTVLTAVREANQAGALQPTTLVSYEAAFDRVFDCRDAAALREEAMDDAALADASWRDQMKANGRARTQEFAQRLAASGFDAMIVRSFAPGTTDRDLNLVVWRWSASPPHMLTLIDDEGRLAR